jgi:hypothetical protein
LADVCPIVIQITDGRTIWDGRERPGSVTANWPPAKVITTEPQTRVEVFKRRFEIMEVRWHNLGKVKILDWRTETGSSFKAPRRC